MKIYLFVGAFCIIAKMSWAQSGIMQRFPAEGVRCPAFTLHNIHYFPLKQASLKDFAGKWLVLDFWGKNCGSCVQSFPRTDAMQRAFSGKVQFMLVGLQDEEGQIEPMYTRFRAVEKLGIPCAFDSSLFRQWCISALPHIVIIDEKGIVRGVTNRVDSLQITVFLNGKTPVLDPTYHSACRDFDDPRDVRIRFNDRKPFLMNGNGGVDSEFLFRSILTRFEPAQSEGWATHIDRHSEEDSTFPAGMFQAIGCPLTFLYKFAYFGRDKWNCFDTAWYGKYAREPIIETKNAVFNYAYSPVCKNVFCYSLIIPKEQGTKARMQQIMQRDLVNYFGFEVSIETRKFPCWKLVATDEARLKLRTAGLMIHRDPNEVSGFINIIPRAKYKLQDVPVRRLIAALGSLGDVILDETGIEGNIDITMECVTNDDIIRSLHENGLSLVPIEKDMKVLVIRDPKEAVSAVP